QYALSSVNVNTTCLPERSTTALLGTTNCLPSERWILTRTFIPSNNLPLSFTAAFTCTIPSLSTSGFISDIRPSAVTSDKAKGATSTRLPVLISGSSLSKTVKAASNVRVSIMEQKTSEVEAVLNCLANRLATTPSKGAVRTAFRCSYSASCQEISAWSYPLF